MNCEKPLLAVSLGFQDNGKRKIKLLPKLVDFNMRTLRDKYGFSYYYSLWCLYVLPP